MQISRCLIDANWGQTTDVVYQFCRQSAFSVRLLPSHGKYVGASSIPFSEYKRKRGDRLGLHWRIPNTTGKRAIRHALIDTNYGRASSRRLAVARAIRVSVAVGRDDARYCAGICPPNTVSRPKPQPVATNGAHGHRA